MNKRVVIALAALGCIAIAGVGCGNTDSNRTAQESTIKDNNESKTEKNYKVEDYVKDAEYMSDGMEEIVYEVKGRDKECSVKDIVVPEITIDSKDVERINKEIKALYNRLENEIKEKYDEYVDDSYYETNYKTYINGDVLSVVIKTEHYLNEVGITSVEFNTYNINLDTKNRLDYKDVCELVGYTEDSIDISVKKSIAEKKDNSYKYSSDELASYKNYVAAKETETLAYFLNEDGILTIAARIINKEGYLILKETEIDKKEESKATKKSKIAKYVEDADYVSDDVKELFYVDKYEGEIISYKSMRVPYIKIESDDAKKVNKEMKDLYKDMENTFKDCIKEKEYTGNTGYYRTTLKEDILSVATTVDFYFTNYYNYNFDVKTKKLVSFDETCEKLDLDKEALKEKYKESVENFYSDMKFNKAKGETKEKFIENEMKAYDKKAKDSEFMHVIDEEGNLIVYTQFEAPSDYDSMTWYEEINLGNKRN